MKAPLRRYVAYLGTHASGPKGGTRLHFMLECGHEISQVPYQRFGNLVFDICNGGSSRQARCRLCAYEEEISANE